MKAFFYGKVGLNVSNICRFDIKIFELVDCATGFILGFVNYTGADTNYEKFDLDITGDIVAHLIRACKRFRQRIEAVIAAEDDFINCIAYESLSFL